ncbi:ATP-binding protein [Bacteroidia bacterium]|nr:ATP-binding protein [Bacteroidia bacterium]
MENPFSFGGFAKTQSFTNRTNEIEHIGTLCSNSINLILISPRRWGKSSLIHHISQKKAKKDLKFCTIDLFNIGTEEEFYTQYLQAVMKATASKLEQYKQYATEFLTYLKPNISLGTGPDTEFGLDISLKKNAKSEAEILDIAQRIAERQNIRIVVAIDEFQNIDHFTKSIPFQKKLRATWQKHDRVSYILYGSKRHLMHELFEKKQKPFFKFGEVIYLEKIEEKEWVKFLTAQFKRTQKSITKPQTKRLAQLMQNHPYYVQQFAFSLWEKTKNEVQEKSIDDTITTLIQSNEWRFIHQFEPLSHRQRKTLIALIENGDKGISSAATINKYDLGTSATVIRSLGALQNAEIIERWGNSIQLLDPVFEMWLIRKLRLSKSE